MSIKVIAGDTYPGWTFYLADTNGWMSLAGNTTAVKIAGKGTVSQANVIGPVTGSVTAENTFTANTTVGSNQLKTVSAFTGIAVNSTITGTGIPAGALVGSFDSVGATINLVDATGAAVNCTATATGVSCTANRGMVTYTPLATDTANADVYNIESGVHWTAGGFQHVPSDPTTRPTITISSALMAGE